ncbi:hypothetical protein [Brevundimonas sp.]|uniref:hypothetical protein n=1 Tax=Brevundimonas sp. TaxID=1871086 RepID=UPI0028B09979|nr:hypothetical protein [Brevundimonas sp.]
MKTDNPAFAPVDLLTADLEIDTSIYKGFAAAIMVKGQPRMIALCREYADAVQLAAIIDASRARAADTDRVRELEAKVAELEDALNTPEVEDFAKAIVSEAQHQRQRWGASHDAGKAPLDWFWLIGYLAQKAATAHSAGDDFKAKHHTISTAAALANWHAAIAGDHNGMRPGIDTPAIEAALKSTAAKEGAHP